MRVWQLHERTKMSALTATVRKRVLDQNQRLTMMEMEAICVDKALKRLVQRAETISGRGPEIADLLVRKRARLLEGRLASDSGPNKRARIDAVVEQGRSRVNVRLEEIRARAEAEVAIMTREKARADVDVRDGRRSAERTKREFETLAGVLAKNGIRVAPL